MKKLLFVLAFVFISLHTMSQMYIIVATDNHCTPSTSTWGWEVKIINPLGNSNSICVNHETGFEEINMELNNIISLGYKLIHIQQASSEYFVDVTTTSGNTVTPNMIAKQESYPFYTKYYLSVPWSASGLEEVPTTLNSLSISPNPANDFVNISFSYDLKGESEIVFISEAGYVYHKESVASISKNETYNIDISKIPAGKYLVTIKNGKTYTTPQKLIIL